MLKIEKKLLKDVSKSFLPVAFVAVVTASVAIRIVMLPHMSRDLEIFLLPWTEQLQREGIAALREGVGNYNIPYLLMLLLATKFPWDHMLSIKLYSILFDYVLAGAVAWLVYVLLAGHNPRSRRRYAFFAFAATTVLPLPILNSALWGQCDSIFTAFAIFAVGFLIKKRWGLAFLMIGISFCFKMQAIFILPLFIMLYFVSRKFSIGWFLLIPAVFFLSTLPAIAQGANLWVGLEIYAGQTQYDPTLFITYPSLTALLQSEDFSLFAAPFILAAFLAMVVMLAYLLHRRARVEGEGILLLGAWCVLVCIYLLPSMHERYGYMGEILLWIWFFMRPNWRRAGLALFFTFGGYLGYAWYLFYTFPIRMETMAVLYIPALGWLTWELVRTLQFQALPTKPVPAVRVPVAAHPAAPAPQPPQPYAPQPRPEKITYSRQFSAVKAGAPTVNEARRVYHSSQNNPIPPTQRLEQLPKE